VSRSVKPQEKTVAAIGTAVHALPDAGLNLDDKG
jgi:hypothetical protein